MLSLMQTTHLQGIGTVNAKPAAELKEGDVTMWNGGDTYKILGVEKLSPKFVRIAMVATAPSPGQEGKVWYRRSGIGFLVGVAS